MQQLATLAELKSWVPSMTTSANDTVLNALLLRASGVIMGELGRSTPVLHTVTEIRNGTGGQALLLREWPALSITSIAVDGINIPAAMSVNDQGYTLLPWNGDIPGSHQQLSLRGYTFARGLANVQLIYPAGYRVQGEEQLVAAGAIQAFSTNGSWAQDNGVFYDNGTPLTKVTGTPTFAGQYELDPTLPGKYNFSAGDNGALIRLTYSYIPGPLVQACCELVGERFRTRDRIGQRSVNLDGKETVSYDLSRMNDFVIGAIQPFKRVIPF